MPNSKACRLRGTSQEANIALSRLHTARQLQYLWVRARHWTNRRHKWHALSQDEVRAGEAVVGRHLRRAPRSNCDVAHPRKWNKARPRLESLKRALMSEPILSHFEEYLPTQLHTDASGYGIGAVLVQVHDGNCEYKLYL
ncbi:hypothetical protein LAZ67_18000090 [Cordylochernes scorpioides]|uniref:Reverse transcriptase/retrotransposon-derived protein RNase H-like domain-containing protein n=1 Tax=Cordylochernes scorpioides TaxID=51811 RepID=A0ABY6LF01_9ARAC|nr:hypothetical protein LAZ67_18000090 [Cordylochernes scorpioides]